MSAVRQWLDRRRPEPKSAAHGPIGVHFTQEHLHLVQLEALADGGLGVRCHESLAYPGNRTELMASPAAIRKLVRRAMRAGKFRGRNVVSAMPPEQVRVMSLSYPANSSGEEAGSILKLMADRVNGTLSDYVIDYVPIRMSSRDGERLALVAVSRLEDVNNYLENLRLAGLEVNFLEIGSLAIKRLISSGSATELHDHVIVINIGETTSHITTISGKRLLADQEVQFGEASILNAIAKTLDLTTSVAKELVFTNGLDRARKNSERADDNLNNEVVRTLVEIAKPELLKLVREINRAFLFADSESHGDARKRIFIVGGAGRWPGMATLLGSLAKLPVESLGREHMPFAGNPESIATLSDQQAAELSIAVGLALRGMSAHE